MRTEETVKAALEAVETEQKDAEPFVLNWYGSWKGYSYSCGDRFVFGFSSRGTWFLVKGYRDQPDGFAVLGLIKSINES